MSDALHPHDVRCFSRAVPIKSNPSAEKLRSVLSYDADSGIFYWKHKEHCFRSGMKAGSPNQAGYLRICIDGAFYMAHRLAWTYYYGVDPVGVIDHLNGLRNDNRIVNLRDTTQSANMHNARTFSSNTSGRSGVTWHKKDKLWRAVIKLAGKDLYLGGFKSIEDAIAARTTAEAELGVKPMLVATTNMSRR